MASSTGTSFGPSSTSYSPSVASAAWLESNLEFLCLNLAFGSILIPVTIALFFFSTRESRRHVVFIFNVLACCSGICLATLVAVDQGRSILNPANQDAVSSSTFVVAILFTSIATVFIDSILLTRLLAFFPRRVTLTRTYIAILIVPLSVKCCRILITCIYINTLAHPDKPYGSMLLTAVYTWNGNPYNIAIRVLEVIDNGYVSLFFLSKLRRFQVATKSLGPRRGRDLLTRIRSLFLVALGSFVFPVILNIALLVLVATNISFEKGAAVLLSNNYVAILGVVFATVWTNRRNWNQQESSPEEENTDSARSTWNAGRNRRVLSTIRFDAAPFVRSSANEDLAELDHPQSHDEGEPKILSGNGLSDAEEDSDA